MASVPSYNLVFSYFYIESKYVYYNRRTPTTVLFSSQSLPPTTTIHPPNPPSTSPPQSNPSLLALSRQLRKKIALRLIHTISNTIVIPKLPPLTLLNRDIRHTLILLVLQLSRCSGFRRLT